jgi:hypothetical protein
MSELCLVRKNKEAGIAPRGDSSFLGKVGVVKWPGKVISVSESPNWNSTALTFRDSDNFPVPNSKVKALRAKVFGDYLRDTVNLYKPGWEVFT